jgi:hypothetical protein
MRAVRFRRPAAQNINWTRCEKLDRSLEEHRRMLEFFVLIGGGLLLISLPGLAYPALVGWRSRRDAVFALCIAAALLSVALFA